MTTAEPRHEPGTDISPHEIAVYRELLGSWHQDQADNTREWLTNHDVAILLDGAPTPVAGSTIRKATARLARVGVLRRQFVSPSYRYRVAWPLDRDAAAYRDRLHEAAEALGQPIGTPTEEGSTR